MSAPGSFRAQYESTLPPFQCDGCERDAHIVDAIIATDDGDFCRDCYAAWKAAREADDAFDDEFDIVAAMNDARGG